MKFGKDILLALGKALVSTCWPRDLQNSLSFTEEFFIHMGEVAKSYLTNEKVVINPKYALLMPMNKEVPLEKIVNIADDICRHRSNTASTKLSDEERNKIIINNGVGRVEDKKGMAKYYEERFFEFVFPKKSLPNYNPNAYEIHASGEIPPEFYEIALIFIRAKLFFKNATISFKQVNIKLDKIKEGLNERNHRVQVCYFQQLYRGFYEFKDLLLEKKPLPTLEKQRILSIFFGEIKSVAKRYHRCKDSLASASYQLSIFFPNARNEAPLIEKRLLEINKNLVNFAFRHFTEKEFLEQTKNCINHSRFFYVEFTNLISIQKLHQAIRELAKPEEEKELSDDKGHLPSNRF